MDLEQWYTTNRKNVSWIAALKGNTSLQVSLNSITEEEHDSFMGVNLQDVLIDLDCIHDFTSIGCTLHAPFVSRKQQEMYTKYCCERWPKFKTSLRPIFNWTGDHPNGISSSTEHLKLEKDYEDSCKDLSILEQPCNQWNDLHILANGQVTKCCIDEAGYQEKDFSVENNNILDIYAKTIPLGQKVTKRANVKGCENCTHPG